MQPMFLRDLRSNAREVEMKKLAAFVTLGQNLVPTGGGSGKPQGQAGTMDSTGLCRIFTFLHCLFEHYIKQPVRMYDLGFGSCHVLLAARLVWGWVCAGCELNSNAIQQGYGLMRLVLTKVGSSKAQGVDALKERARGFTGELPMLDRLLLDQSSKTRLRDRLLQLNMNTLFAFWATWASDDKQAGLEVFAKTPGLLVFAVSDWQECEPLYIEFLHKYHHIHLWAYDDAKMASGGKRFSTWMLVKACVGVTTPALRAAYRPEADLPDIQDGVLDVGGPDVAPDASGDPEQQPGRAAGQLGVQCGGKKLMMEVEVAVGARHDVQDRRGLKAPQGDMQHGDAWDEDEDVLMQGGQGVMISSDYTV